MSAKPKKGRAGVILGVFLATASLLIAWSMITKQSSDSGQQGKQDLINNRGNTHLRIAIQPTGKNGLVLSRYIDCPGDKHCTSVDKLSLNDLELPNNRVCTQQYAGPTIAWITGVLNGQNAKIEMNVANGCEIARWNRLAPILGIPKSTVQSNSAAVS